MTFSYVQVINIVLDLEFNNADSNGVFMFTGDDIRTSQIIVIIRQRSLLVEDR